MYKNIKFLLLILIISIMTNNYALAYNNPDIWAESYIVIDAESGRIIGSKNADKKLPMASTTKIMTSILTIDYFKNLNKIVKIPVSCTNIEGSSVYLKPNQKVKIIDLLYGTMLRSGNDSALALAYFGGENNIDNFIKMMNDKANDLGAFNTHFTNPNGLHDKEHYTTSYDLALITKYAMENQLFKDIASCKLYKATSLDTTFYNKNKVVHQYKYGNGVKIGYTKAAGRCLVASAQKDNTEIIVVVLNDNNWFSDSYKIFDWAFEQYKNYNIIEKGQFVCTSNSGEQIITNERFNYLLTEDEIKDIRFESKMNVPLLESGEKYKTYGSYNIYLKDKIIHSGKLSKVK